ncbi:MAG: hypothetical protein RBR20_09980 [Desulfobacterales bacterium]|nr:hypothetical protein [Desulfobacteraceae bacterium]MDY0312440.1 hypothetical protein [Desulfobacterales bacterium]
MPMATLSTAAFTWIDAILIAGYRLTGFPFVNFLIGTLYLSFLCVIAGELTVALALKINRRYFNQLNAAVSEKEQLALGAYQTGNMEAYKGLNKEATDAWGKQFFTMFGYSAGMFWSLPFALAWLQTRFAGIRFAVAPPISWIIGATTGYLIIFILLYILARIVFKYLRPWLPFFNNIQRMLDEGFSSQARTAQERPTV